MSAPHEGGSFILWTFLTPLNFTGFRLQEPRLSKLISYRHKLTKERREGRSDVLSEGVIVGVGLINKDK